MTTITTLLTSLGYAGWVPVVLAGVGFFSAVATIYPPTWPGSATIHKLALLLGNAKPETPAS